MTAAGGDAEVRGPAEGARRPHPGSPRRHREADRREVDGDQGTAPEPRPRRGPQVALFMAAWAVWAWVDIYSQWVLAIILVALVLSVVLHELAHFLVARWVGMRPRALWLGFGPRLASWSVGGCEMGVRALPLGGSCQIPQEQWVAPGRPRWSWTAGRVACAMAGPACNFLLCLLLVWTALAVRGTPTFGARIQRVQAVPGVHLAGLQAGQVIQTVGGWDQTAAQIRQDIAQARPGQRLLLGVQVPGWSPDRRLQTYLVQVGRGPHGRGTLGLDLAAPGPTQHPVLGALVPALDRTGGAVASQVRGAARLASPQGVHAYADMLVGQQVTPSQQQLRAESVIGLVRLASQMEHAPWADILILLAAVNLALALFNALPLPPMDGGQAALLAYQQLAGRPVPSSWSRGISIAVLAVLAVFALVVGTLDILHPAANPFTH